MFDASQRLVICNQRYIEMYGLSAEVVKPGCSFRELIAHRKVCGSLIGDEGGRVCASGPPAEVAKSKCRTAPYLARYLA